MKAARMNLRIDPETDARIRRAAASTGMSVSAFVASAAGAAADDVLADRREFVRTLDRRARDLPRLREAAKQRERLLSQ